QQAAHQIGGRIGEGFAKKACRVDNMWSGHRDGAFRVEVRDFSKVSHGDRAYVSRRAGHQELHHFMGHYSVSELLLERGGLV
ncbi:hypothetical protein ABIB54_003477, partial [Frigoribacterium sp. UYMn621]